MLKKTVALVIAFILMFSIGVNAMTLNVPKEEYYEGKTYSNVLSIGGNAEFMYNLIFLGIIEDYNFDINPTQEVISNIIKKAFNVKTLGETNNLSTNQELVKVLCNVLSLEGESGTDNLRTHLDYGLIGKEYLPYYEVFAKNGYISDKKSLLRPNKPVTYNSLIEILSGVENEIYAANGAKVISGEVKRINFVNTTKTLTVKTEDYDIDIPFKSGRKTAYLKDDIVSFSNDIRIGETVSLLVNDKNEIVFVEKFVNELGAVPKVEGIYKAKVYLYDYIYGKIIFNDLHKFNGVEFEKIPGKYTEFKVSDTALLYEYYRKTNGYYINRDFLDINAYFIVDTNLKGENEIIYLNIVN